MIENNLGTLSKVQLEKNLEAVIKKANESRCRACPYCRQNDAEFIEDYGHAKVATSAFFSNGRWRHLDLNDTGERYRGGFNWMDCRGGWGNGMLVAAGFVRPTLNDAIAEASKILALPDSNFN